MVEVRDWLVWNSRRGGNNRELTTPKVPGAHYLVASERMQSVWRDSFKEASSYKETDQLTVSFWFFAPDSSYLIGQLQLVGMQETGAGGYSSVWCLEAWLCQCFFLMSVWMHHKKSSGVHLTWAIISKLMPLNRTSSRPSWWCCPNPMSDGAEVLGGQEHSRDPPWFHNSSIVPNLWGKPGEEHHRDVALLCKVY